MKCEKITKVLLAAVGSAFLFVGNVQAAEEFSSAEIKKIRFLSRALIKSRANEKVKIENEIKPERERVKSMRSALEALETSALNNLGVASITPVDRNSSTSVLMLDGVAQQSAVVSLRNQNMAFKVEKQSGDNNERDVAISRALTKVASERSIVESNIPSAFQFWRQKTRKDKRNEHLVNVLEEVEKDLKEMQENKNLDLQKIKLLKEKMTIKKQDKEVVLEEIEPTFHTITKHRN